MENEIRSENVGREKKQHQEYDCVYVVGLRFSTDGIAKGPRSSVVLRASCVVVSYLCLEDLHASSP